MLLTILKTVFSLTYREGKLLKPLTDFWFLSVITTELVGRFSTGLGLQVFVEGKRGKDEEGEKDQAED